MRIQEMNMNTLVLVSQPWLTIIVLLVITSGLLGLSLSAFMDGETGLGSILLIATLICGSALFAFSAFERVCFDRPSGLVTISGRNVFRKWSKTVPLSDIKDAEVLSSAGGGKRNRRTYVPALVLKDAGTSVIPLSAFSGSKAPAERAAAVISDWLAGTGAETLAQLRVVHLRTVLSLVAVNLSAIIPVVLGHWSVWELITFYWVELLIVSLLFGAKMVILSATSDAHSPRKYIAGTGLILGWIAIWVVGTFLTLKDMPFLRGDSLYRFIFGNNELLIPVAAMIAGHFFAFISSVFPSGRFNLRGVEHFGEHPFSRIFVLAIIILIAPVVMGVLGMPILVLAAFLLAKLSQDWRAGTVDPDQEKRSAGQMPPGPN